jgi:hypothetical protein
MNVFGKSPLIVDLLKCEVESLNFILNDSTCIYGTIY